MSKTRDIDLEVTLKESPASSPLAGEGIHFRVNPETADKLEWLRRKKGWSYGEMLQEAIDLLLEVNPE